MDQNEIIVTPETLDACIDAITADPTPMAIDTETTGLRPFHNNRLFAIQIATWKTTYYFNFNWYMELGVQQYLLDKPERLRMGRLFKTPRLWILQNAKFDLHFLAKEGWLPEGEYYDTQVAGRVQYNLHEKYSLDAMCERELNERKDDAVMKWLDDNKCFTMEAVPGRAKQNKNYHFDQVPFDIMTKYGAKDVKLTLALYYDQQKKLLPTDMPVVYNEMRLIKTLYWMEKTGVQIDADYCRKASEFESARMYNFQKEWKENLGALIPTLPDMPGDSNWAPDLVDSGTYLAPIFTALGFTVPLDKRTENPRVDADTIATFEHPLARILENWRDADKRYSTYMGILYASDAAGVVHTNFKQSGTVTGRMSSMEPNLQNLSSDDESPFPIRKAFVPRPGFIFVSIDYKQMEFRLLLEYAQEIGLINKIMNGYDPHDATAEMTGLTRKAAKTLNFGLVYGMGIAKLARAIGVTYNEAKAFKQKYFAALPGVQDFLWTAAARQRKRGQTWNWFGRRFQLTDRNFAYRAPNSIIQGGCADVFKIAANGVHGLLKDHDSRMVLHVHDEILLEMTEQDLCLIPEILKIMETAYPHKNIPLTCSVSYSLKSFGDMTEVDDWREIASSIGKSIPSEGAQGPEKASEHVVL